MITLYVKTHLVTGLKYFGKTTLRDFNKYKGSGKYWLRHIAKHGNHVHTFVVGQYEDQVDATRAALAFSVEHDIVNSKGWANLIPENGLDGLPPGIKPFVPTNETRLRWSESGKRRWKDPTKRVALVQAQRDSWDDVRRLKNSDYMKTVWTPDRREKHSTLLKANYARNPAMVESISKRFKNMVRTDTHKKNISKALSGKAKSIESIIKLKWTKMGGSDKHANYIDYCVDCYHGYELCRNYSTLAREFNTSVNAVISAVNFYPRLKMYLDCILEKAEE